MKVHFESKTKPGRPVCCHVLRLALARRWKDVTCERCIAKRRRKP